MKPDNVIRYDRIFTATDVTAAAETLIKKLKACGKKITAAESCTGGLICASITSVSGASEVFDRGFVTYANVAKEQMLGVSRQTLESFGAVSVNTAREMSAGARANADADVAVAVTGIAGPTGGTPEKPVGLVYIGVCTKEKNLVTEYHFSGNRDEVRLGTVCRALTDALENI